MSLLALPKLSRRASVSHIHRRPCEGVVWESDGLSFNLGSATNADSKWVTRVPWAECFYYIKYGGRSDFLNYMVSWNHNFMDYEKWCVLCSETQGNSIENQATNSLLL